MPCARSTCGSLAQSLQTRQWVRFVAGSRRLGHAAANWASWPATVVSSDAGVKSLQEVFTCRASSKPSAWKPAAWLSLIGVFG